MLSQQSFSLPFALLQLILLCTAPLALAQDLPLNSSSPSQHNQLVGSSSFGSISGTVNFPDKRQLCPGVMVTAKSTTSGLSRNVLTDSSGHFEFSDLPNGAYIVSVDESGFSPTSTTAFVDGVHDEVSLDVHPVASSPVEAGSASTVSVHELEIPAKARDSFKKGLDQLDKQDYARSATFFKKAIDKYSSYYEAYYHLGLAQAHLGNMDQAADCFQSAINLSGGHYPWAEFAYALILAQRGNIADGERLARDGLEQDQGAPDGYVVMAVIRLHQNRFDDAEKNARRALALNPHSANAYMILADVHASRHEFPSEIKDLDTYLALGPSGRQAQFARDLRKTAQRLATEGAAKQAKR